MECVVYSNRELCGISKILFRTLCIIRNFHICLVTMEDIWLSLITKVLLQACRESPERYSKWLVGKIMVILRKLVSTIESYVQKMDGTRCPERKVFPTSMQQPLEMLHGNQSQFGRGQARYEGNKWVKNPSATTQKPRHLLFGEDSYESMATPSLEQRHLYMSA